MNQRLGDLVVLVADKDMEQTLQGLLSRPPALGIRPLGCKFYVHQNHDSGCRSRGVDFLRTFATSYDHALLIFDYHGAGADAESRVELEARLERDLGANGWQDRAAAIVIDPELEAWVWSDSPHVPTALGWPADGGEMRDFLHERQFLAADAAKPSNPKEALEACRRQRGLARSPSFFRALAEKVSFRRCTDPSFDKLCRCLRGWFGA